MQAGIAAAATVAQAVADAPEWAAILAAARHGRREATLRRFGAASDGVEAELRESLTTSSTHCADAPPPRAVGVDVAVLQRGVRITQGTTDDEEGGVTLTDASLGRASTATSLRRAAPVVSSELVGGRPAAAPAAGIAHYPAAASTQARVWNPGALPPHALVGSQRIGSLQ